jgi:hypothetical protein
MSDMNEQSKGKQAKSADEPVPASMTPEQLVEQLRALRAFVPNVEPLTDQEREFARRQSRIGLTAEAVQQSINVIGASDLVTNGLGMTPADAQQFLADNGRWSVVEAELRAFLNGMSDANLIRRQRTAIIAAKAYGIAKEVARDNPDVRPQVKHIQRLRALARRKKTAAGTPQTPQSPSTPEQNPATPSSASTESKQ